MKGDDGARDPRALSLPSKRSAVGIYGLFAVGLTLYFNCDIV